MRTRHPKDALPRLGIVVAALALSSAPLTALGQVPSPSPAGPSGADDGAVLWISTSPLFPRTGTALAVTSLLRGCMQDCIHLWITRDGGHTWSRPKATGWKPGRSQIVVDGGDRELLFSSSDLEAVRTAENNPLDPAKVDFQRSDDGGETWTKAGPNGIATPAPTFAADGMVAIAGNPGYVVRGQRAESVAGSGGTILDLQFAFAPSFPGGGRFSPAFVIGFDKPAFRPVVGRCDPSLSCKGNSEFPGALPYPIPPTLYPSSSYADDGVVFAQTGEFIYKSEDGGATFARLTIGEPGAEITNTPGLALAPRYAEKGAARVAYAAILQTFSDGRAGGGIYKTSDGGKTWQAAGNTGPLKTGATAVAVAADGRLFAGYLHGKSRTGGLLCSRDGGRTWRVACAPVGASARGGQSESKPVNVRSQAEDGTNPSTWASPWTFGIAGIVILAAGGIATLLRRRRSS